VYDRTEAKSYERTSRRVVVHTDRGRTITARKVFFATGYETREFLARKIVRLSTTYALVSEPLNDLSWWGRRALVWETGSAYLYARTTSDGRVLIGGEDDQVQRPARRDARIPAKSRRLLKRFARLFPDAPPLETAFDWAGAFGSTRDGLAYIGTHPAFPSCYFALGFGGNGITFSVTASQILRDLFLGRPNADAKIFRFDR
jgi:glycine/D-amino acid oxidase-like deaminating enzyme